MTQRPPAPEVDETPEALQARLRRDLTTAMKQRHHDDISALRTLIADIDNAHAINPPNPTVDDASRHVAGARHGVGSTDAARTELSLADIHQIIEQNIDAHLANADHHEHHGQIEKAHRLRHQANHLGRYLPDVPRP